MAENNTVFTSIETGGEGETRRVGGEVLSWREKLAQRLEQKHAKRQEAERRAEEIPEEERGFVQFFKGIFATDEKDNETNNSSQSWIERAFDEHDARQLAADREAEQQRRLMELPEHERTEFYMVVAQRFKDAGGRFLHFVERLRHSVEGHEAGNQDTDPSTKVASEHEGRQAEPVDRRIQAAPRSVAGAMPLRPDATVVIGNRQRSMPQILHASDHGTHTAQDVGRVLQPSNAAARNPHATPMQGAGAGGNLPPRGPTGPGMFNMDGPSYSGGERELAASFAPAGAVREVRDDVVHYIHKSSPRELLVAALIGGYVGARRTRRKMERAHLRELERMDKHVARLEDEGRQLALEMQTEVDRRRASETALYSAERAVVADPTPVATVPEQPSVQKTEQPSSGVRERAPQKPGPHPYAPPLLALMQNQKHPDASPVITAAVAPKPVARARTETGQRNDQAVLTKSPKQSTVAVDPLQYEVLASEPREAPELAPVMPVAAVTAVAQDSPRVRQTAEQPEPEPTPQPAHSSNSASAASEHRESRRETTPDEPSTNGSDSAAHTAPEQAPARPKRASDSTGIAMQGSGPASVGQILSERYGSQVGSAPTKPAIYARSDYDNSEELSEVTLYIAGVISALVVIGLLLLVF